MTGGKRTALYFELPPNPSLQLTIEHSVISDNIVGGEFEGGAGLTVHRTTVRQGPIIIIRNVSFLSNEKYGITHSSTIALYYVNHVTFTDCKFHGNIGTAIGAYQSTFYMNGYNSFINNSATKGGAIALLSNSYMFIQRNTEILFQNNYADVGGAIFVHTITAFDNLYYVLINCSVMLPFNDRHSGLPNITVSFTGNTGWDGGDVMYGVNLYFCVTKDQSLGNILAGHGQVLDGIHVHVDPVGNDRFSLLSSDPMRACVCTNGTPDCTTVFMNTTKYPGETFTIPAVVVGENFGTVTGSVHSKFLPLGKNSTAPNLEGFQQIQKVSRSVGCTELQYTVLSENEKEVMVLTAKDVTTLYYGSQSEVDELVTT